MHRCLQYVQHQRMTNKSLRERFRLPEEKGSVITRIINAATEDKLIVNASTSEISTSGSDIKFGIEYLELVDGTNRIMFTL
jgi:SOS response regulatory protein OraA/RecX